MKKVTIAFPCEWVAYSPTILNLVEILKKSAAVQVIAIDNGKYNNAALPDNFLLLRVPPWVFKVLALFGLYRWYKRTLLTRFLKKNFFDVAIGVDALGFYAVQRAYGKGHFISLEIEKGGAFPLLDQTAIQSIVIQSKERLDYLYPTHPKCRIFYLPNGPIYREPSALSQRLRLSDFDTLFLGNVLPSHGIYLCIDAIQSLPYASITVKGTVTDRMKNILKNRYHKLILENRLIIDDSYTPQDQLLDFLQGFDVGFCFYNFNLIARDDFNYLSSPSGKMYNYFSAGIPVIGSDIIGLKPVKEFNAGVLLSELNVETIKDAMLTVRRNHEQLHTNSKQAARALDFAKPALEYTDFILHENTTE